MQKTSDHPLLSPLAKGCIVATLFLILIGAIVTTAGAGMAAPNAPHVGGEFLNPDHPTRDIAWYQDPHLFKEHTHRLVAILVGTGIGLLCAGLWRNWLAFLIAFAFMGIAGALKHAGLSEVTVAQLRVWPAMVIFITLLIIMARKRGQKPGVNQWLALTAYVATCIQAALGSLRVEIETAGYIQLATNIRIFHGIFAQLFLSLLVILAARLSPVWQMLASCAPLEAAGKIRRMALAAFVLYIVQIACAAYLRHNHLGLLIPAWPAVEQGGGLFPVTWTPAVIIHFLHTRILPILLTGHLIGLAIVCAKRAVGIPRITRLGWGILALVFVQFLLGVLVIWKGRHPHITNTHVLTGAFLIACIALLFARASRLQEARPS